MLPELDSIVCPFPPITPILLSVCTFEEDPVREDVVDKGCIPLRIDLVELAELFPPLFCAPLPPLDGLESTLDRDLEGGGKKVRGFILYLYLKSIEIRSKKIASVVRNKRKSSKSNVMIKRYENNLLPPAFYILRDD